MSTTAGTLLTDLLSRLRDPNATMIATDTPPTTATGTAFGLQLLTYCQIHVNHAERLIVNTSNLTLGPTALYSVSSLLPGAITVLSVRQAGYAQIDGPVDPGAFGRFSRTWLSDVGPVPNCWTQIGKDLLAVVPIPSPPPIVSVRYLPVTNTLSTTADLIVVPDDTAFHVSRLTELVCLVKTRQLDSFSEKMQSLMQDMKISVASGPQAGKAL